MKKVFFPLALAATLFPGAAAQKVFEGTWKMDFTKIQLDPKPDEYVLLNGMYTCKTCTDHNAPVKADGTDQPLPNFPYADTLAIKVVNAHQVHTTSKKAGKVVAERTMTVSADGKTLKDEYYFVPESGNPITETDESKRVADGPPGSHAISGSWQGQKLSTSAPTFSFKVNGDEITMVDPNGAGFTAKLDGTEAPYKGDPGTTSVRVKLIGTDTLEETDLRDGKVLYVTRVTVAPDGKTAKVVTEDKRQNTTASVDAVKQ